MFKLGFVLVLIVYGFSQNDGMRLAVNSEQVEQQQHAAAEAEQNSWEALKRNTGSSQTLSGKNRHYRLFCWFDALPSAFIDPKIIDGFVLKRLRDLDTKICKNIVINYFILNAYSFDNKMNVIYKDNTGILEDISYIRDSDSSVDFYLDLGFVVDASLFSLSKSNGVSQKKLAENIARFADELGLDGFVFKLFESQTDAYTLESFFKHARREFKKRDLEIIGKWYTFDNSYRLSFNYLDYVFLRAKDNQKLLPDQQTHYPNALVRSKKELGFQQFLNYESILDYFSAFNVPSEKIILAIIAYANQYILPNNATATTVLSPYASYKGEVDLLTNLWICKQLTSSSNDFQYTFDTEQYVPYIYSPSTHQWIGFEDRRSLDYKIDLVKSNKFAGIYLDSVNYEDYNNTCGQGKYPLASHIIKRLRI